MQLIRNAHKFSQGEAGCVLTMGNFDGVHLGHQALINEMLQQAQRLGLPTVLMSFEPHPIEFFQGKSKTTRLMRLREKWLALLPFSIDYLYCARFNHEFSSLTPEQFVERILIDGLSVKHVVIGDDFHFGAKRAGDVACLQALGKQFGFTVSVITAVADTKLRVSSSRIRDALLAGHLDRVQQLMGRPYNLVGKVIYGDQRGREFGFPTANICLHRKVAPMTGIYVVTVELAGLHYQGVASIGYRPAYRVREPLLEVHLLNFNQDIYGQFLQVEFLYKLRDEEDFKDDAALIARIGQDVVQAQDFFNTNH